MAPLLAHATPSSQTLISLPPPSAVQRCAFYSSPLLPIASRYRSASGHPSCPLPLSPRCRWRMAPMAPHPDWHCQDLPTPMPIAADLWPAPPLPLSSRMALSWQMAPYVKIGSSGCSLCSVCRTSGCSLPLSSPSWPLLCASSYIWPTHTKEPP